MTQPTSRYLLSAMLTGTALLSSASPVTQPHIVSIENRSSSPAEVKGYRRSDSIGRAIHKQLDWPISIPFISIDRYRDQFIAGDPYFPQGALAITTLRGKHAIWRDETGIVCALEFVPGKLREDCTPIPLVKHFQEMLSHSMIQSLMFVLSINKEGELSLEIVKSKL